MMTAEAILRKLIPLNEESPEAERGTELHGVMEKVCKEVDFIADPDAAFEIINNLSSGYDAYCCRCCLEHVLELVTPQIKRCAEHWIFTEEKLEGTAIGIERGGTPDLVIVFVSEETHAFLFDWKFGRVEVDAPGFNEQFDCYAVMASDHYEADKITVACVQPFNEVSERLAYITYTRDQFKSMRIHLAACVFAALSEDLQLIPGDACFFCRAAPFCHVRQEYQEKHMQLQEAFGAPSSPEEWGELATAGKVAEKFANGTKKLTKAHAEAGNEVAGYKLQGNGSVTSVADEDALVNALEAAVKERPEIMPAVIRMAATKGFKDLGSLGVDVPRDALKSVPKAMSLTKAGKGRSQ
jgi:hypothetical protein